MTTIYSLLGATGSSGSATLRAILANPPQNLKEVKVFVRSNAKLRKSFPSLENNGRPAINVIEGDLSNHDALKRTFDNTDVIINCIGTNSSPPGERTSRDAADAVISALKALCTEKGKAYKAPVVLLLRSASLNPVAGRSVPTLVRRMLKFCLFYAYDDLDRAGKQFQSMSEEGLLRYIFVDPPALHDPNGKPTGYSLSTTDPCSKNLGYADLGAGFAEVAERRDEFADGAVGVSSTGKVTTDWPNLVGNIVLGLRGRILGW